MCLGIHPRMYPVRFARYVRPVVIEILELDCDNEHGECMDDVLNPRTVSTSFSHGLTGQDSSIHHTSTVYFPSAVVPDITSARMSPTGKKMRLTNEGPVRLEY